MSCSPFALYQCLSATVEYILVSQLYSLSFIALFRDTQLETKCIFCIGSQKQGEGGERKSPAFLSPDTSNAMASRITKGPIRIKFPCSCVWPD